MLTLKSVFNRAAVWTELFMNFQTAALFFTQWALKLHWAHLTEFIPTDAHQSNIIKVQVKRVQQKKNFFDIKAENNSCKQWITCMQFYNYWN